MYIYNYIYIYIYKRNLTSLKMHLRNGNWLMQDIFVARIQNQYKLAIFDMIKYLSLVQTPYFTPLKLYPATFVTKFYLKHYFGDIQHQFSLQAVLCVRPIPHALQTCERLLLGRKSILLDSKIIKYYRKKQNDSEAIFHRCSSKQGFL